MFRCGTGFPVNAHFQQCTEKACLSSKAMSTSQDGILPPVHCGQSGAHFLQTGSKQEPDGKASMASQEAG
ncbi:uncharacterized [Tachysurus ichikawai]